jgi:hypothetical protein
MQLDPVHPACPQQQRIGRAGGALVGVPSALHHQAQPMPARELDGRGDVGRAGRRHGIGAGRRGPGIAPTAGLGQRRIVADRPRVLERAEERAALGAGGRGPTGVERRAELEQSAADPGLQPFPLRLGRPAGLAGPEAAEGAGRGRLLGGGGRHHRQGSDHHHELASGHGGTSSFGSASVGHYAPAGPANVTAGTASGTTGAPLVTTGAR